MSSESQPTAPASLDIPRTPASPAPAQVLHAADASQDRLRRNPAADARRTACPDRRQAIGRTGTGNHPSLEMHAASVGQRRSRFRRGISGGRVVDAEHLLIPERRGTPFQRCAVVRRLEAAAAADQASSCAEPQYQARQPPQHRGALRSRQRFLSIVAGFQHVVFVRDLFVAGRSPRGCAAHQA